MTAALVLHGALNEGLFFASSAELWFSFAKLYPHAKAYREKSGQPDAWKQLEKMATNTKQGKTRLENLVKRVTAMGAAQKRVINFLVAGGSGWPVTRCIRECSRLWNLPTAARPHRKSLSRHESQEM